MNNRNRLLLTSAVIMLGTPAAASAECPPVQQETPPDAMEAAVLSDGSGGTAYPEGSPAVKTDTSRDPANSMIDRLGLVDDRIGQSRIEALAGTQEQFQRYIAERVLDINPPLPE